MFPGLGDGHRLWLIALWIVWAALLFGGFIFGKLNADGTHRILRWARMASSFTLVIATWSWFAFAPVFPITYSLLIAIGMTLGFLGDLFMAQLIPLKGHILGGIGSFGLGHIAYIIAFIQLGNERGLFRPLDSQIRWNPILVWWLIALVAWYIVVFRGQKHTFLHYAALPYALLLASTAGLATGLATVYEPLFIPLAIGAALFLLSDLILAAQLFNGLHFKMIGDVVWLTYGPAQMLIVYSVASALAMWNFILL